ncbi:MAG: hypothetical protein H7X80_08150 [bacterium]|nr:hypothetical protein [Candidatus Kapabacteria bacterium]
MRFDKQRSIQSRNGYVLVSFNAPDEVVTQAASSVHGRQECQHHVTQACVVEADKAFEKRPESTLIERIFLFEVR